MKQIFYFLCAFTASLLLSCASQTTQQNISSNNANNGDGFFIVDCLLPGQIRKLGQLATYITSRQPIKTTASDCEMRGGEYVAYDRANYGTSLKIWLPRAQAGDAEAQAYVGEIYEKGLGLTPDYTIAVNWYQKAAAQGNSKAQINLGYLYEQGLGVPKDKNKAMEWYRKSSGLAKMDIPYAATLNVAEETSLNNEIGFLKSELKNSQSETKNLLQQLQKTQQQLNQQSNNSTNQQQATTELETRYQQQIKRLEDKLSKTKKQTQQISSELKNNQSSSEIVSLKSELKNSQNKTENLLQKLQQIQQQLKQQQSSQSTNQQTVAVLEKQYQQQIKSLENKLTETEKRAQQIVNELKNNHSSSANVQRELLTTQAKLAGMEKRLLQFKKNTQSATSENTQQHSQIAQLKAEKKRFEAQIENLQQQAQTQATTKKPSIEIIDPPFVQVRGKPTVVLRSMVKQRDIFGKVIANAGLLSLLINDRKISVDEQGLFQSSVAIRSGETPVSVVAVDKKGGRSSLDFVFSLNTSSLVTTEIAATASDSIDPNLEFGNYYALIIGNNKYQKVPSLNTPINDATAVEQVLKQKYGFKTKVLLNATRYQILSALNKLRGQLTENDNLLVYYAGHGELDKVNMRGHWLPVDADADNTANWVSTIAVTDILNAMSVRHIMVVADSCYSGAMTRSSLARIEAGLSKERKSEWLKAMIKAKSRTVLTSGGLKPVMDGGGGDHSIFAKAFIKALRQNNNLLEGQVLYRMVSSGIVAIAAGYGIEQVPIYAPIRHAGHESGEFFFIPR